MKSLNGNLIRISKDLLKITFNKEVTGTLYYSEKIDGELKFIKHIEKENELEFKDPDPKNRTFYFIKCEDEELILAERLLPFKKFCNFRDLGGYETNDGRKVKWGLFYRSEALNKLKGEDLEYFNTLGIKYIFDYRSLEEVKLSPDRNVEGTKNINISAMRNLDNQNLDMESYLKGIVSKNSNQEPPEKILMDGYIEMPLNNLAFKELIKTIENPKNLAILQHCTSGKDRTGLGSALILLLLGVSEKKVIEDYMLSNEYRKGENHRILQAYEKHISNENIKELIENILGVKKKFIELSLNRIKETYGSYETYFLKEYGLNKEKIEFLRNQYLY